jgi:zinc protease
MIIYGLPEDYFSTYRERIRAVTTEQVLAAARDHLHADALQLVVVGDPAQVRAPLETLGFGPLTVYDTEGHEVES